MTVLRTVFMDGEEWRALIEDRPDWNLATLPDGSVIAIREVYWPTAEGYGDFDENGWLRA
jgi:transposase